MGGMLATRLALDAPARVAALALINPIGLEDWQRWVPYAPVEVLYEQARAQQPEDVRNYMRDAYFAGQWKLEYDPLLTIAWPSTARVSRGRDRTRGRRAPPRVRT